MGHSVDFFDFFGNYGCPAHQFPDYSGGGGGYSLAAMRVDLVLFDTVFFSFDYSCLAFP